MDTFRLPENESNIQIGLDNLEKNNILNSIKMHLNNYNINLLNKQPNVNLIDSQIKMLPSKKQNNFIFYSKGYIINSKILKIIKNNMFEGKEIKIKPINIFNKGNNIFVPFISKASEQFFVTIGNLNDELIFTANSCLQYYNSEIFESEKKNLLNESFKNYIISRKCHEKNLNVQYLIKETNKEDNKIGLFLEIFDPINPPPKRQFSSKIGVRKRIGENEGNYNTNNSLIKNNGLNPKQKIIRNVSHERYHTPMLVNNTVNKKNNISNIKYISNTNRKGYKKIPQIPRNKCNKTLNYNNNSENRRAMTQPNKEHNNLIEKSENNQINNKDCELENKINENNELKVKNEELKKELNKINNDYKIKIENIEKVIQMMIKEKEKKDDEIKNLKERFALLEKEINVYKKPKEEKDEAKNLYQVNMDNKENKEFIFNKNQNERLKKENIDLINQNNELEKKLRQNQAQLNKNNQSNDISFQNQNQNFQRVNCNPLSSKENPLAKYKEPTLIGLNNIGVSSFINATLQCLSQTKSLTKFFLKDSKHKMIMDNNIAKQNKNSPQLSPVYLKLIKMLWDKKKKEISFSPKEFMETVEKMNPLFKKGQVGDSKDFIIFILEQIHKELNINFQNQSVVQPLNQYDRENTFSYFINNDFKKECSIISDIFFGITETTNVCLYCKNYYSRQGKNYPICYNYGIFNSLIFPLEEVKNFRNEYWASFNYQINQNNTITLNDCLCYNQNTGKYTGGNKYFCKNCNKLFDSEFTSRIYSSPNVLILILTRANDDEYNIKLDFNETLDLTQFVVRKDRPQMIYNLYGVITHTEQSGSKAHYIGFCKSPINDKWYKYNDANVNLVEDVQKEIINFGNPIILFYQKFENKNNFK